MIITQVATVCAWCAREQGQTPKEGQSHGICTSHRNKEREKLKEARAVYGTCGHLAKDPRYSCGSPRCSQYSW